MKYRELNPGEIIQEGDEFNNGVSGWYPCNFTIGDKVDTFELGTSVRRPIAEDTEEETQYFVVYYNVSSRRMVKIRPKASLEAILVELATEPADFVNYVADNMGIVIDDEYIVEDERTNGGFSLCTVDQDGIESQIWEQVPELSEDALRRLDGDLSGLSTFDEHIFTAYSMGDDKEQAALLRAFPEKFLK